MARADAIIVSSIWSPYRYSEQVLELLRQHGAAPDLTQQVSRVLHHRPVPTLYVAPADDSDEDNGFFFEGSFRFNRGLIDRCMAAGRRAYAGAARSNPEFFRQL